MVRCQICKRKLKSTTNNPYYPYFGPKCGSRYMNFIKRYYGQKRYREGGPGSGNWGHKGIPGQRGGSAPGGGLGAISPLPFEKAQKVLLDKANEVRRDLSEEEKGAIEQYSYGIAGPGDHYIINEYQRKGREPSNISTSEIEDVSQRLDSVLEKSEIPEDVRVYRGMDLKKAGVRFNTPEELIGKKIKDKGYMSTSLSLGVAEEFQGGDDPARISIDVPQGSKGLFLPSFQSDRRLKEEKEVLFPRGSTIKIDDAWTEPDRHGKEIVLLQGRLVDQGS